MKPGICTILGLLLLLGTPAITITAVAVIESDRLDKQRAHVDQAFAASNANLASLPRTSACNDQGAIISSSDLNCFDAGAEKRYRIVVGDGYKVFSLDSAKVEYLFTVNGPRGDDLIERRNSKKNLYSLALALEEAAEGNREP